ncbi:MAG: adenylyl-sulfate kinase [Holosporaceae bacterium]|jgi:adenylylsulfate kinase-like enzyme|nr:adenylyl-sulfate kinase [Holosporaceae bacterium]
MLKRLFWITGLAGAGKSTCANYLVKRLKERYKNVVLIDGDNVREICGNDLGYDLVDRKKNAFRIVKLCEYLYNQGVIVVCATVSLYKEIHEYIYVHFKRPQIIFLDISPEILLERNQKKLYTKGANVIGIHMEYDKPDHPSIVKRLVDSCRVFKEMDKMVEDMWKR